MTTHHYRGVTPFGPPMWQAEADTELTLSALLTTAVGQKALFHGRSIQKHPMPLFNIVICGGTDFSCEAYLSEWFIFIYCRVIFKKMAWSKNKPYLFVLIL